MLLNIEQLLVLIRLLYYVILLNKDESNWHLAQFYFTSKCRKNNQINLMSNKKDDHNFFSSKPETFSSDRLTQLLNNRKIGNAWPDPVLLGAAGNRFWRRLDRFFVAGRCRLNRFSLGRVVRLGRRRWRFLVLAGSDGLWFRRCWVRLLVDGVVVGTGYGFSNLQRNVSRTLKLVILSYYMVYIS